MNEFLARLDEISFFIKRHGLRVERLCLLRLGLKVFLAFLARDIPVDARQVFRGLFIIGNNNFHLDELFFGRHKIIGRIKRHGLRIKLLGLIHAPAFGRFFGLLLDLDIDHAEDPRCFLVPGINNFYLQELLLGIKELAAVI